jgi:hypothetical protein
MGKTDNKESKENPFSGLQLWKIVGMFALVFAAVQIAMALVDSGTQFLMDAIHANENVRVFLGSTISHAIMIVVMFLIAIPVIRSALKRPGLVSLYPVNDRQWIDLFIGMGFSAAALLVVFAIEYALGFISITGFALSGSGAVVWLRSFWLAMLLQLVAAVSGEVLYRGLLMRGIEICWDAHGALFISAIIFGGAQVISASMDTTNWLKMVPLLALTGVMLGWAYLRTGNLWLATGIHFAWNLLQYNLLNLGGIKQGSGLVGLLTNISGPRWFTGSSVGIESGAAGIIGLLLVCGGIYLRTAHQKRER